MPDWFVWLGLASLVGGLAYFVQLMLSAGVGIFTRVRDLIADRRLRPAPAYVPLVEDRPRSLRDRAL